MLDAILAIKFVHLITMAVMVGAWTAIVLFMLFAHRSGNTSVVALTARFVVRIEWIVMAGAIVLQPLSGIALMIAIGASITEYWLELSLSIYAVLVVIWVAVLVVELRIRNVSRDAALASQPLPDSYRRLFRIWTMLAAPLSAVMIAIMALMVWQPHWE